MEPEREAQPEVGGAGQPDAPSRSKPSGSSPADARAPCEPSERFRDRAEAGRELARVLEAYRGQPILVLGIARGGVPVAAEVARALDAELDVLVVRKVGAPGLPELALGAVTTGATSYTDPELVDRFGVAKEWLRCEIERQLSDVCAAERDLHARHAPISPAGRTVVLVDDGLATGSTMCAAILAVQRQGARQVVVAVPVGSEHACAALAKEVDELVCLRRPVPFLALGFCYRDFEPVSQAEVLALLEGARHVA